MRYIDINKLQPIAEELGWNDIKNNHMRVMNEMTPAERKTYINSHPDWNKFQSAMLALSYNKCWYSEAPIGNSDFVIDHFRPKNRAKQKENYADPDSETIINKKNGYWWLAYDYTNYRLCGTLANSLRRDRLGDDDTVKGKGDFFPLDKANGRIANDKENVACEVPILLDPTNPVDVTLLTFDEGEPIPATTDEYEIDRVKQSIFYYHLDLEQLNRDRKIVWENCERHIKDAKESIDNAQTRQEKRRMMKKCFEELRRLANPEYSDYTSTAKACIVVYSEIEGYAWLKNLLRTL